MLAILAEVFVATTVTESFLSVTAIIVFALSQAAAIIAFYMDLRNEPGSLVFLVIIPAMFLAGLLISVVASLG